MRTYGFVFRANVGRYLLPTVVVVGSPVYAFALGALPMYTCIYDQQYVCSTYIYVYVRPQIGASRYKIFRLDRCQMCKLVIACLLMGSSCLTYRIRT